MSNTLPRSISGRLLLTSPYLPNIVSPGEGETASSTFEQLLIYPYAVIHLFEISATLLAGLGLFFVGLKEALVSSPPWQGLGSVRW